MESAFLSRAGFGFPNPCENLKPFPVPIPEPGSIEGSETSERVKALLETTAEKGKALSTPSAFSGDLFRRLFLGGLESVSEWKPEKAVLYVPPLRALSLNVAAVFSGPEAGLRVGKVCTRGLVSIHSDRAEHLYPLWTTPTCIISDGPYGVNGFLGDQPRMESLPDWHKPHIRVWSKRATPQTTLWFPLVLEH